MKLTRTELLDMVNSILEEQTPNESSEDKFFNHSQVKEVLDELELDFNALLVNLDTLYTLIDSRVFGKNLVPMRIEKVRKLVQLSDRLVHTVNEWKRTLK